MLKIRLRRQGRKNRSFFRLVLADCRSPRDGKYLEMLGWYNPLEAKEEKALNLREERVQHWLNKGAQMTESAQHLVKKLAPRMFKEYQEKKSSPGKKARPQKERGGSALQPK